MSVGWVGAENHKKAKKIYKETPTTSEAEIMENSMKIANKFSHFHSASPGSVCHAMFVFYGFRPQCVHCNNYTTQSTQKEPRGSTSKKKWKEQIKNRTEIHSYPLTVGISHNRCRKKRRITSLAVLHKFHNLQISHVFGQKLGVNEHWPNGQ